MDLTRSRGRSTKCTARNGIVGLRAPGLLLPPAPTGRPLARGSSRQRSGQLGRAPNCAMPAALTAAPHSGLGAGQATGPAGAALQGCLRRAAARRAGGLAGPQRAGGRALLLSNTPRRPQGLPWGALVHGVGLPLLLLLLLRPRRRRALLLTGTDECLRFGSTWFACLAAVGPNRPCSSLHHWLSLHAAPSCCLRGSNRRWTSRTLCATSTNTV